MKFYLGPGLSNFIQLIRLREIKFIGSKRSRKSQWACPGLIIYKLYADFPTETLG